MKRGAPLGYTIVEVMVFLAVTSALFVMVAVTFQGRQARTEFFTATREMETAIADVVNDITSGYYGSSGNFTCELNGAGDALVISPNQSDRGTNGDCIFIGKAMHFGINGDQDNYNIMTIAGRRISDDLPRSFPQVVPSATEKRRYPVGIKYGGMRRYGGFHGDRPVAGIALLSSTNYSGTAKGFQPGALQLQFVVPLPYEPINSSTASVVDMENFIKDVSKPIYQDPSNGLYNLAAQATTSHVELCLDGTAQDSHAVYVIGTHDDNLQARGSVVLEIREGLCASSGFAAPASP